MYSENYKKIRKMAEKLSKSQHRFRVPSKSAAHALFRAKIDKKDLPHIRPARSHKDPKYANLSIAQFERKYLNNHG